MGAPGRDVLQRQPAPADEEPTCAEAPRHLGDIAPEVPCDAPTVNLLGMSGSPQLQVFDFCVDSDVLLGASSASVAQFAKRQAAHASFVVHGFASPEGAEDYNQRLSCHRALRIARELMNAGVRSEQIREVSGLGATGFFSFGDPGHMEANRVALVLAESGEIAPLADPDRPAFAEADKQTIVDRARERLIAGEYQLAADAFIDFWTCGRTPAVRHAVDRLRVLLPENQQDENLRSKANGQEEDPTLGINGVRVSNTALRADNPVECTMGRLVDMAFHHALKGEVGLSPGLSDASEPSLRHQAGLHLIALAGLGSCAGNLARPRVVRNEPAGIDAPLLNDPLATLDPPACARTPQETRLLRPAKDAKDRAGPTFRLLDQVYRLHEGEGTLDTTVGPRSVSTTSEPVISAAATVALTGSPELLADYEIGFMQTILDDLAIAEYVSGHVVVQRLPVPLRTVDPKESAVTPPPWMALSAVRQPDAKGDAKVEGTWRLQTAFETALNRLLPAQEGDFLDTWQRRTGVAIWLLKRRIDAPADRFGVEVIDGRTYELTQHLDLAARRSRGDLLKGNIPQPDNPQPGGEAENLRAQGGFEVFQTSDSAADLRMAQFGGAIPEHIDLARQVTRILEPRALAEGEGLTSPEYTDIVRRILDTPEILDEKGQRAAPRLGFVFNDLTVTIQLDRATGRMIPVSGLVARRTGAVFATKTNASVSVDSPGLGQVALNHLALALGLRLEKRDFLGEARAVVLRRSDIPANGALVIRLQKLQAERQLIDDPDVRHEMAEMWACSELTSRSERFLISKEFARTYWVDRNGALQRLPPTEFFTSTANGEALTTNIECGNLAGAALGTVHTHPEDSGDGPNPSEADVALSKTERCGRQNFIISKDLVVMYASGRAGQPIGERRSLLPPGVTCNRSIPDDVEG